MDFDSSAEDQLRSYHTGSPAQSEQGETFPQGTDIYSASTTSRATSTSTTTNANGTFMVMIEDFMESPLSSSPGFYGKLLLLLFTPMLAKNVGIFVARRLFSWRFGRYAI